MKRVIAGRFQTKDDADAAAALIARCVETAQIGIVDNNPPGQHDAFAVRGDEYDDPRADDAFGVHHGHEPPKSLLVSLTPGLQ